jgi:hypothetical protein
LPGTLNFGPIPGLFCFEKSVNIFISQHLFIFLKVLYQKDYTLQLFCSFVQKKGRRSI